MQNKEIIKYENMSRNFLKGKVPLEENHPKFFAYFLLQKHNVNPEQKLTTSDIKEQKEIINEYSQYLLNFKKKLSELANIFSISQEEYSDFFHTAISDPAIFVPIDRLTNDQINNNNNNVKKKETDVASTNILNELKLNPKMLNYEITTEHNFQIDDWGAKINA